MSLALGLFILAGLFLPLYPQSIAAALLLQRRDGNGRTDDRQPRPWAQAAWMLLAPLIGAALVAIARGLPGGDDPRLATGLALWGGLTAVLYAFRLLSARDGRIWLSHLYLSSLALAWVGLTQDTTPLWPALGFALSLVPLLFLLDELARRFGIARIGLYPGLGLRMPRLSLLFTGAVLAAIAVPPSPAFFALADLAFGGLAANELLTLLPVGLSWLLWTWAGSNLLGGLVFGQPREDLVYEDLDRRRLRTYVAALLALGAAGIVSAGFVPGG